MKKSAIWIIIATDNKNIVYQSAVAQIKSEIIKYFGIKNVEQDDPQPIIVLKCEVTQNDIDHFKKLYDSDTINFVVITGADESDRVKGDFIDLTE